MNILVQTLLLIYGIGNIVTWIAFAILGCDEWEYGRFSYIFVYPSLWEELDDKDINTTGKIIVLILFSILTMPAYLLWLVTLGLLLLGHITAKLFCKIFRKRK